MDAPPFDAITIQSGSTTPVRDRLAPEAPLHIKVNGESYITTMRTPDGHDAELAHGLLFTEGIIDDPRAPVSFSTINDPETNFAAQLNATVDPAHLTRDISGSRNQMSTASCGICGTREPADLELHGTPITFPDDVHLTPQDIHAMLHEMREHQTFFNQTGGTHAAGTFTLTGDHLATHEDIGRHNAVDKVIGTILRNNLEAPCVLTVSSRVSYEIVTKAYRAAIPVLVAVSAPSDMAVETARAFGITLIAFCRDDRISIYTHPQRIAQNGGDA